MSHLGVQLVIGRLLTDEQFRHRFEQRQRDCLLSVRDTGIDLDDDEMTALVNVDPQLWATTALRIDRRLQRRVSRTESRRRPLTPREHTVLRGVFEGRTNKQIAADLGVSEAAVKASMQQLFRKMHVRTRAQLVRAAMEGTLTSGTSR